MLECFLHPNAGGSINYLDRVKQFWILLIYSSRDLKIVETLKRHASSPAVTLFKNQTCVVFQRPSADHGVPEILSAYSSYNYVGAGSAGHPAVVTL
jgi:hypothetical protein